MSQFIVADLSTLSAQWNRLQVCCALVLFGACDVIASTGFDIAKDIYEKGTRGLDYAGLGVQVFLIILAVYFARQTWSYGADLSEVAFRRLKILFRVGWVIGLALFVVLSLWLIAVAVSRQTISTEAAVGGGVGGVVGLVFFIYFIVTLKAMKAVAHTEISGVGMSLWQLLLVNKAHETEPPPDARGLVRIDQPVGLLWIVMGIAIFLVGAAIGNLLWDWWVSQLASSKSSGNPNALLQISKAIEVLGAYCVIKGRAYFLPNAEAVLAIDKRAPILYLRSFINEKPDNIQYSASSMFIDRSLEMKLAKNLNHFGPFVAIGSKQDAVPKQGAMRLMRSDSEWQDEVGSLMARAQRIVAAVGFTQWIKWELGQIATRKFTGKTLFLFPVTLKSGFRIKKKRAAQQDQRLQALAAALGDDLVPQASQLGKDRFLLAYVDAGPRPILLTCNLPSSNAQFLAGVIGHYLLSDTGQAAMRAATSATAPAHPRSAPLELVSRSAETLSMWGYFARAVTTLYASFKGRAHRTEFWSYILFWSVFTCILGGVAAVGDVAAGNIGKENPDDDAAIVFVITLALWLLATLIPFLAILARRLRDVGLSGWFAIASFVPVVGWLFSLVCCLLPSRSRALEGGIETQPLRT